MPKVAFRSARPIALVGLMGAGKSTVGRLLAARLDLGFVDSDEILERLARSSIAEIFESLGEAHFRKLERDYFEGLDLSGPFVLATGGGVFADPMLRRRLVEQCITIWLDAPVEQLAERVKRSDVRPLLKVDDHVSTLQRLAESRSDAYASAHLRIACGDRSPETIVEMIVRELGSGLGA